MNRREYLLTCLAEEGVEVAQRATKALRFGLDEVQPGQELNNAERIIQEFRDMFAVLDMLFEEGFIQRPDAEASRQAMHAKKAKVEKYMRYSEACGTLSQ